MGKVHRSLSLFYLAMQKNGRYLYIARNPKAAADAFGVLTTATRPFAARINTPASTLTLTNGSEIRVISGEDLKVDSLKGLHFDAVHTEEAARAKH